MAVKNFDQVSFTSLLTENFTPSGTIKTPEKLFGRQKSLLQIERALSSVGRQVLIYGDRGVGKTSVALTTAYLLNNAESAPIYVVCGEHDRFDDVIRAIGRRSLEVKKNFETGKMSSGGGVTIFGVGATTTRTDETAFNIATPLSINDALEVIRYISSHNKGRRIIVVDEMERISSSIERAKFAEFIKNVPEVDDRAKFIFCGIASTVDELIGAHPSAGRILETIPLAKMHHNDLWSIIENVAEKISIEVDKNMLIRISQLSDGFPHYVHLVGESMFWNVFDDQNTISNVAKSHFDAGIKGALERAEPTLRQQYMKATMKTKNTEDYEHTLWSLADTNSDRRQLSEIYDSSYKRIARDKKGTNILSREKFNQRLLTLRKSNHGNVVTGYGSGWFGFRENIIRGYVRLKAETQGIHLGRDIY